MRRAILQLLTLVVQFAVTRPGGDPSDRVLAVAHNVSFYAAGQT